MIEGRRKRKEYNLSFCKINHPFSKRGERIALPPFKLLTA